jgi:hypothetical protein
MDTYQAIDCHEQHWIVLGPRRKLYMVNSFPSVHDAKVKIRRVFEEPNAQIGKHSNASKGTETYSGQV